MNNWNVNHTVNSSHKTTTLLHDWASCGTEFYVYFLFRVHLCGHLQHKSLLTLTHHCDIKKGRKFKRIPPNLLHKLCHHQNFWHWVVCIL